MEGEVLDQITIFRAVQINQLITETEQQRYYYMNTLRLGVLVGKQKIRAGDNFFVLLSGGRSVYYEHSRQPYSAQSKLASFHSRVKICNKKMSC
jgi:hypothetical protein